MIRLKQVKALNTKLTSFKKVEKQPKKGKRKEK